jgi:FkbM family methyltransferase
MTIKQVWGVLKNAARAPEILRCASETAQWRTVTAAYLGFSQLQYPFTLRLHKGEQIHVEELTDLKAFWQIFLRRVYRVHAADHVILDLGANIGIFTVYAARNAPSATIFAVEPFPETFRRLVDTVRDHHLEKKITCLNIAATGFDGIRVMPDIAIPSQRRAIVSECSTDRIRSGTQIAGRTLETILDENHLTHVDLMKMDIEGSEYEVLLATPQRVLSQIHRIALEYHGDAEPHSKKELFDHLGRAGFEVTLDISDAQGYGVAEMIRGK